MENVVDLVLPDFDLPSAPATASAWHAKPGQRVVAGERLIEVTAGDVTVDLSAPADGVLEEQCVKIDELLTVGQRLARIRRA